MYQHNIFHSLSTATMALGLLAGLFVISIRLRRGEVALVRRISLLLVGIALLLAGNLMRGGPYDAAADLLGMLGDILLIVTSVRLWQWQKVNKPAA